MFKDPLGREEGQPLDPLRHTAEDLLIRQRGNPRLWSAVWQQSPRSLGGHIIRPDWFIVIPITEIPEKGVRWVRGWDLAFSEKQVGKARPDYTAGCLLGVAQSGREFSFYIKNILRWQAEWPVSRRRILDTAEADGRNVRIVVEGGGPQKSLSDTMRADVEFSKYIVRTTTPVKDKVARAQYWADRAEVGKIKVARGEWNKDFFDECEAFNNGLKDDQIDSVSLAYWYVSEFLSKPTTSFMKVRGLYTGH